MDYAEAKTRLIGETLSISQIFKLVDDVTCQVLGAETESTYLLFSGNMWDDTTHTSAIADSLRGQGALHQ
jgi:hypothetical protein